MTNRLHTHLDVTGVDTVAAPEAQDERLPAPDSAKPEVLRVLVVDDSASILRFLASAFATSGCEVSTAGTAEEALGLLTDDPFDLIVSDIKMPGLSGLDLLRAVKGKQPGTPVVLITGVPSVNSAVFGLRLGAYDYLPKPFSVTEIRELIQRLRRDRRQGDGRVTYPAGLTEELARKQYSVEVLFRIGELALQGLETGVFVERVLDYAIQSLRCEAALILLCDQSGKFSASRKGDADLVSKLLGRVHGAFADLVKTRGQETLTFTEPGHAFSAIGAVIPGVGDSMGIMCLAREARSGGFLPTEKDLLLGYARTTAVALQKIALRDNLETNLVDTIMSFVNALESKDPYLKGHSARVSLYAGELATVMGQEPSDAIVVCRAGMLHDLGKLVVLDHILRTPRRLTDEEMELIRAHPVTGDKILKPLKFLAREAKAVRHHHERYDGQGYPDRLRGESIPLIARIVTVADAFDAMTSDRPYRAGRPIPLALDEIRQWSGTQFDPVAADAFLSIPVGRLEEISRSWDGRAAIAPEVASPLVYSPSLVEAP